MSAKFMEQENTVSTHSRLKAAGDDRFSILIAALVSTHSRLKAAGIKIRGLYRVLKFQHTAA